jgi:hypothetical protein
MMMMMMMMMTALATILASFYDLHRYTEANNSVFPLNILMFESLNMTKFKADTCCSIRQTGSIF